VRGVAALGGDQGPYACSVQSWQHRVEGGRLLREAVEQNHRLSSRSNRIGHVEPERAAFEVLHLASLSNQAIDHLGTGYDLAMDIWDRIRFARDQALKAEEAERQRIADADTDELQRAASVRLATRQAVREALDDVLDEHSEPAKGQGTSNASGTTGSEAPSGAGSIADDDTETPLVPDPPPVPGTPAIPDEPTPDGAENSANDAVHGVAAEPPEGLASDVQDDPETQVSG
jgi:hypothetical protein